jgi:hypothetical protein
MNKRFHCLILAQPQDRQVYQEHKMLCPCWRTSRPDSHSHGRHVARKCGIKLFRLLNILPHVSGRHGAMKNCPHRWHRTAQPGKLCPQMRTICFGNLMYGLNHEHRITENEESDCNEGITTFVSGSEWSIHRSGHPSDCGFPVLGSIPGAKS